MYSITDEEIDFILTDIEKRGITSEDIKYNLLDHVCCIVENEMPVGTSFMEFYANTIARFYRKELREIEEEARNLITYKNFYAMKRTLKISGLTAGLLTIIGAVFKSLHLPGAGIMVVSGLVLFCLIFLPLSIALKYRDDKNKKNQIVMTIGMLAVLVASLGVLFKIMHWPGANMLVKGGLLVVVLGFIPAYFTSRVKDPETKFNAVIHSIFMLVGSGMLYALTSLGASHGVTESLSSIQDFTEQKVMERTAMNESIYQQISDTETDDSKRLRSATKKVLDQLLDTKAHLISSSEEVSFYEARTMNISAIRHPKDNRVVRNKFADNNGEFGYSALKTHLDEYNKLITDLDDGNTLCKIDIDQLKMEHTILGILLQEFVEIQLQLLANESSYLSLKKGLLVQR